MQKLFAKGIKVGGSTHPLEIYAQDAQSSSARAGMVAQNLITAHQIDLMLVEGTPDITNPVCDICEAASVPCISSVAPWQAWFFGRNGNPKVPFKWTYHFFWGLGDIINVFLDIWKQVPNNKAVGALWPNDADGNAWPARRRASRRRTRLPATRSSIRAATPTARWTSRASSASSSR